ncbi:MAG TPA: hypothetical protein VF463_12335 [Sphingobium sp.]
MQLSSEFCSLQEKAHLDKAASATLPNVRDIAAKAALVWRAEGGLALKREQRHLAATQGTGLVEDDMSGPDPDEYIPREHADPDSETALRGEDRQA